jgi:mannose-6-phosphate isomerase
MSAPRLIPPRLVPRVWGGNRLRALIASGEIESPNITQGAAAIGEAWFGTANETPGALLVKLLDVHERLSVQVHPDDQLAARLHGSGAMGKHEAWVILDAAPDAELLLGRRDSVVPAAFVDAINAGDGVEAMLARLSVAPGDVIDVPPGLVHALLPGLFVWEVQQPTERTYRVADWGRNDPSRPLHLAESAEATDSGARGHVSARLDWHTPGVQPLLRTPQFSIRAVVGPFTGAITTAAEAIVTVATIPLSLRPSPDVLTVRIGDGSFRAWSSCTLTGAAPCVVPVGLALLLAERP